MATFSKAFAAFGLAVAGAFLVPSTLAYEMDEVCSVKVTLDYTAPQVSQHVFEISGAGQNSNQDATGEMLLMPGTFTLKTDGYLCADANVLGFTGSSTSTTIDGTTDVQISITALDQEVYSTLSQNTDYAPVIVSVSVTPKHAKYGDDVTITVGAIDPVDGVNPASYTLTFPDANAAGLTDHVTDGGTSCVDGTAGWGTDGSSCAVVYTAVSPDSGNIKFNMVVADAGGQTDTVDGYLVVDPTSGVQFEVANYHAPIFANMEALAPSDGKVAWEQTATFDVVVDDSDIVKLGDVVEITVVSATAVAQLTEQHDPSMQTLNCLTADVTVAAFAASTDGTDQVKFSASWAPWAQVEVAGTAQSDWGETWCEFEFQATDSRGLSGHTVKYTLAAIGTANTGGGFGQVPYFTQIFVSDFSPAAGDVITIHVTYTDPDTNVKLTITPDAAFSSDAPTTVAAHDCTGGCQESYPVSITAAGAFDIVLELEDATDSQLKHTQTLSFVAPSRHRRSASGANKLQFAIKGNELSYSVSGLNAGGSTGGRDLQDEGNKGGGSDGSNDSGFSTRTVAGGAAAIGMLVVVVAAAVITKARRSPANAEDQEMRRPSIVVHDENQQQGIDL